MRLDVCRNVGGEEKHRGEGNTEVLSLGDWEGGKDA